MPVMIRPNNKGERVAKKILGTPPNKHSAVIPRIQKPQATIFDQNVSNLNDMLKKTIGGDHTTPY